MFHLNLLNPRLRILLGTNALLMLAAAMFNPIYALFVTEIGGDILDASMIAGVLYAAGGVTVIFSGTLADKVKFPKRLIILGYGVVAVGYAGFAITTSLTGLLIFQAIIGIGSALFWPAFDKIYSINLDKKKEASEWSIFESLAYFAWAAGALFGGFIAARFGFTTMFIAMSIMAASSAIYLAIIPNGMLIKKK